MPSQRPHICPEDLAVINWCGQSAKVKQPVVLGQTKLEDRVRAEGVPGLKGETPTVSGRPPTSELSRKRHAAGEWSRPSTARGHDGRGTPGTRSPRERAALPPISKCGWRRSGHSSLAGL